jgi:hypothetical protein
MPHEFHGFGTMYYGSREKNDDGSFITTRWFVLLYAPIFPLGSYRVRPVDGKKGFSFVQVPGQYATQRVEANLRQIVNVYLVAIGFFLLLLLAAKWMPYFR